MPIKSSAEAGFLTKTAPEPEKTSDEGGFLTIFTATKQPGFHETANRLIRLMTSWDDRPPHSLLAENETSQTVGRLATT